MYEVIYDYTPQNKGDITLHQGDRMQRVNDVGCGWVIGHNATTRETGHFPADYVKPIARWRQSLTFLSSNKNSHDVTGDRSSTKSNCTDNKISTAEELHTLVECNPKKTSQRISEYKHDNPVITSENMPVLLNKVDSKPLNRRRFKLMRSIQGNNRCLKSVLGVVAGLMLGLAIFLALFYSFQYSLMVAFVISAFSTLILCLGLALSIRVRCVVLLAFPSLASGKGRAAFLSIITGFLLVGPVTNIVHNSNEIAVSMACITELAYNQSKALQNKLQEPIRAIRDQVINGVENVNKYGQIMGMVIYKLRSTIQSTEDAVNKVLNAAAGFKNRCTARVSSGLKNCQSSSRILQNDCMKTLDSISINPIKNAGNAVNGFVRNVGKIFGKKRRRRRSDSYNGKSYRPLKRYKRGVLGKLCNVFVIGDTVCGGFKTLDVCNIVTLPNLATGVFSVVGKALDAYTNLFELDVKNSNSIGGNANSSQTATQIVNNIKSDLQAKFDAAIFYITLLNQIMSISILLLIMNAFLYERKYRSKLSFDNFYITNYFKQMDQKRKRECKMSILPLKRKERNIYTDSRAPKLSVAEMAKCKIGLAQVLLHAVICIMLVLFDYLLHFILYLLNKHGDIRLVFTGETNLNIEITGNGLLAKFFRELISGISVSQVYNSTIDIDVCLLKPREPDTHQMYVLATFYVFALFFVLMQGYGQRLLHFIAAFFYPEKEHQRINHLYRIILVKRKNFIQEVKQLILTNAKYQADDEMASGNCVTRCLEKISFCRKIMKNQTKTCRICKQIDNISCCQNKDCEAIFCEECFVELDRNCPLCEVVGDDEVDDIIALEQRESTSNNS